MDLGINPLEKGIKEGDNPVHDRAFFRINISYVWHMMGFWRVGLFENAAQNGW